MYYVKDDMNSRPCVNSGNEYSLDRCREVQGWRYPNWAPTEYRAKKDPQANDNYLWFNP